MDLSYMSHQQNCTVRPDKWTDTPQNSVYSPTHATTVAHGPTLGLRPQGDGDDKSIKQIHLVGERNPPPIPRRNRTPRGRRHEGRGCGGRHHGGRGGEGRHHEGRGGGRP